MVNGFSIHINIIIKEIKYDKRKGKSPAANYSGNN